MVIAPWNVEIWQRLRERRENGAMPHAMLLCGPPGLGKREFAESLGAWLLCEQPGEFACGACRSCHLYAIRTQRDPLELRPDGTPAQPNGHPNHPDARFVGFIINEKASPKKSFTEIVVEQIRELSAWLALPSQFGRAQFVLLEPADKLNVAAANALLKTLEEPGPGRHLVLVTDEPARLTATIRSRCQRIEFRTPAAALASSWLRAQRDVDAHHVDEALRASEGNPGMALAWLRAGAMKLRGEVATDLTALNRGSATAHEVAQRWSRDDVDLRLQFAASLVRTQAAAQAQANAGVTPLALTTAIELPKLTAWFDRANRTRELLRGPLRPELALLELLVAWAAAGQNAANAGIA